MLFGLPYLTVQELSIGFLILICQSVTQTMTIKDAIGTTKLKKKKTQPHNFLYQSESVPVCVCSPRFWRRGPVSSLVVFGNGRTHTGEVDGSGGSRLANYCLGASVSYRDNKRPVWSQEEKHLKDVIIQWVSGRWWWRVGWNSVPPLRTPASELRWLCEGQGRQCTRRGTLHDIT